MTTNPTVEQRLALAAEKFSAGALTEAEELIRSALEERNNFPPALHLLGLVQHGSGRPAEAIEILQRARVFAPRDVDMRHNLGIFLMEQGKDAEAEAEFRAVLALVPQAVEARGNLAVLLEKRGEYVQATSELEEILRHTPDDENALRLLTRTLRHSKQFEREIATCKLLLARIAEQDQVRQSITRAYFLWYDSVDRDPDQAKAVLSQWLEFDPEDTTALHMMAAHGGAPVPSRADGTYLERYYDEFADTFEQVLSKLGYRAPALIEEVVAREFAGREGALRIGDLGCGTGLCGPRLKPWAQHLTGVDLSQRMLDKAQTTGVYDQLVRGDLETFLAEHPDTFDLLVAGDTLIYFGDLRSTFSSLSLALKKRGRFIGTVELQPGADTDTGFVLNRAGRYAHSLNYLKRVGVEAGLRVLATERHELRQEYGKTVHGLLLLCERTVPVRVSEEFS
jgi:predicted TPR repeat methyltransferase